MEVWGPEKNCTLRLDRFHLDYEKPRKLTWQAGKSPMNEDVFPIENGDFPMSC